MYMFLSLNLVLLTSVMFQCLTLYFLPTQPGLMIVVVVNALAIDELPELPGHLRTSNLSILLIPKEWFEGEKGD